MAGERAFQLFVSGVMSVLVLFGSLIFFSIDARMRAMETLGSPVMREKMANLEAENRALQRRVTDLDIATQRDLTELKLDVKTTLELVRVLTAAQKAQARP